MRVIPPQQRQRNCNKVEDAIAMLTATWSYKGDKASATSNDTSNIVVMITAGTLPRKAMLPRTTTLPGKETLPRTADWPSTWKATLPTVGNFAKKGSVATKRALFLLASSWTNMIAAKGEQLQKKVKVAKAAT
jgi:hypothetical protein